MSNVHASTVLAPRMFFIVGRGRSGTTLVSTYLNAVPGISIAPESLFMMNLRGVYGSGEFTAARVSDFCKDVFREQRMRNWAFGQRDLTEFMAARHEQGGIRNYPEICRIVYEAQAHFSGAPLPVMVGDKNPHYSLFIPELIKLFPDAPFLHVVRDPRANIVSYRRVKFDYSDPALLAGRWNIYNETILGDADALGSRYYRIRFEDFVHDPNATIAAILNFLGFPQDDRPVVKQVAAHIAEKPWHPRLGNSLDVRAIDEWREQLSSEDTRLVEAVSVELMKRFDYKSDRTTIAQPPFGARWLARTTVAAERLLFALPMRLRSTIITIYRRITSTI